MTTRCVPLLVRLPFVVRSALPRCPYGGPGDGRSGYQILPAPRQQALRGRVVTGGYYRVQVRCPLFVASFRFSDFVDMMKDFTDGDAD
jgi:hypothetical protein